MRPLLLFLAAALAAPAAAAPARLQILAPPMPVAPGTVAVGVVALADDGRATAPPPGLTLEAEGARVTREGGSPAVSFAVEVPREARQVALRARAPGLGEATASLAVGLGATGRIEVSAEPAAPVKGRDVDAVLSILVRGSDGEPDAGARPPIVEVNTGQVEAVERVGPGRFRARYVLPERRWPEVAIVAAFAPWPHDASPWGAVGRAVVPLAASIELPGRTPQPNVEVKVVIAGEPFGPVQADETGAFKVPVVVPPGHRFGSGHSVDRFGNRRVTPIDLHLPEISRLACVASPRRLPADGRSQARVVCAATDPLGAPLKSARLSLQASAGVASPFVPRGDGTWEAIFTAPAAVGAGKATLVATFPAAGERSREEVAIELAAGPPARAELVPSRDPLPLQAGGRITIPVADAAGAPVTGARIALAARTGAVGAVREAAPGRYEAELKVGAPPADAAPGAVWSTRLTARIDAPAGPTPARLMLERDAAGALLVHVRDIALWPVAGAALAGEPGTSDALGVLRLARPPPKAGVQSTAVSLKGMPTLRGALHEGVTEDGKPWAWPPAPPAASISAERVLALVPELPVDVQVEVEGTTVRWRVLAADGKPLPGRPVEVLVTGGRVASRGSTEEGGSAVIEPAGAAATVTVVDGATGVGSSREVRRP